MTDELKRFLDDMIHLETLLHPERGKRLAAELKTLLALFVAIPEMRRIGAQMSNCMWNIGHNGSEMRAELARRLADDWDRVKLKG